MIIFQLILLFLNIYFVKFKQVQGQEDFKRYNIDWSGWKKRSFYESPPYTEKLYHPVIESEFRDNIEITLTNEGKQVYNKWEYGFKIKFSASLFVTSDRDLDFEIKICDKNKHKKLTKGKYVKVDLTNLILKNFTCKLGEEFIFQIFSNKQDESLVNNKKDLVSFTNFTLKVLKDEILVPLEIKDKTNYLFKIDGQQIDDYGQLFLNEHFPLFDKTIKEYYYVEKFKEITVFEFDYSQKMNKTDICFAFEYYNIDNAVSLKMVNQDSNYQLNLVDLDSSYYEEEFTSYSWFQITGLCLFRFFGKPEVFSNKVQFKFVSTSTLNSDSNLFALSRFSTIPTNNGYLKTRSYLGSWNTSTEVAAYQWVYFPTSKHFAQPTNDIKMILKSKPQSRPLNFYLMSELIEYEPKAKLTFYFKSEFGDDLQLKIKWIDQYDKLLKIVDARSESTKENTKIDIDFTEKDAKNFTSNLNQLYRILIHFYLPEVTESRYTKDKTAEITNLQYSDPCKINYCLNNGKCKAVNSHRYRCECFERFTGDFCEYVDRCFSPINETTNETGNEVCNKYGDMVKCKPVDSYFECDCGKLAFWDKEKKKCKNIDQCTFKICGLNEQCKIDKNQATCSCRDNYSYNETLGRCIQDYCANINACGLKEDCMNVAGYQAPLCFCKIGFYRESNGCLMLKKDNPFVRQELGCDHTYKILPNNKAICICLDGYKLVDNKKCIKMDDLKKKEDECSKCNFKQHCVKSENNEVQCVCKNGFSGQYCENNLCDRRNDSDLMFICGKKGCKLNTAIETDYRFECKCGEYGRLNKTTGKCELINPCDNRKCINSICVPYEKSQKDQFKLSSMCHCKVGEKSTLDGQCLDSCEKECSKNGFATECAVDLQTNQFDCLCNRGYQSTPNGVCYISSDSVNFTVNMILKSNNSNRKIPIPNNTYIKFCNLVDGEDRNCYLRYDDTYHQIYYTNITKDKIHRYINEQLRKQLREAFENIIYQRPFEIWVLSFRNLTEIDYSQFGFKTNYSVDVVISSKFDEAKEVPLMEQVSRKRIESKCFQNLANQTNLLKFIKPAETAEDSKFYDHIDYVDNLCAIEPNLIIFNFKSIKPKRENLCEIPKVIECPAFSDCNQVETISHSFRIECNCKSGYNQLQTQITENEIKLPLNCYDIDECTIDIFKECDLSTTFCENTPGSFNCNCFKEYKRVNATSCTPACAPSTGLKCFNGRCKIIRDHYEMCICDDGWKGQDCSIEVEKVKLLKTMLVIITSGLSMVIIGMSIIICYFYVKRTSYSSIDRSEKSDRPREEKSARDLTNPAFSDDRNIVNSSDKNIIDKGSDKNIDKDNELVNVESNN